MGTSEQLLLLEVPGQNFWHTLLQLAQAINTRVRPVADAAASCTDVAAKNVVARSKHIHAHMSLS